jgi:hypothetical protein
MSSFTLIEMFDSVSPDIPEHVTAKAGYVAGNFPTWNEAWFKAIKAKYALSIAIHLGEDADMLDIETGDAQDDDAPQFVRDRKAAGRKAVFYRQASAVMGLIGVLNRLGFIFGQDYYIVSAHYTGAPHVCGPQCGFGIDRTMHGTQWTDHANGLNLDESLVSTEIFQVAIHPEYAVLDRKRRRFKGASLRRGISELGRVQTYDRLHPGPERDKVENDCLILFNRLWDVVHEHGRLAPGSDKAKHNWTLDHRGERGRVLWAAAKGKR